MKKIPGFACNLKKKKYMYIQSKKTGGHHGKFERCTE